MMRMRFFFIAVFISSLCSCNTTIGLGRDIKSGYYWTKGKMQGDGNNATNDNNSGGAPIY